MVEILPFIRPLLFSVFCTWVVALVSFFAAVFILRKRKGDREAVSFALFWLILGLAMALMGYYTLVLPNINKPTIYAGQIFISLSFIPLFYHLTYKIWGSQKISRQVTILFCILPFLTIFFTFYVEFPKPIISDWGASFKSPFLSMFFFGLQVLPVAALTLYDFFSRITLWLKRKKITESYKFYAALSLIVILVAGSLDQRGLTASWQLLLYRTLEMSAALMAYLCYTGPREE